MQPSLTEILVDPVDGAPLELEGAGGGEISEGELVSRSGHRYPIRGGIPRFVSIDDPGQLQTQTSFGFKWTNREGFGSEGMQSTVARWLVERYGFSSPDDMCSFFASRRTLDAGCGAGLATSGWMTERWADGTGEWVGADISGAIDVACERLGANPRTHFVQADISRPPFRPQSFEAIMAEGVLHHTPSTERSFRALVPLLEPGGELMIYVYRLKAPVREFTDDYVREELQPLSPDDAWSALRPLTTLGKALADLKAEIDLPDGVPLLGISPGRHDVQRLVYWHFAKLFWNDDLTFEENNHLNFDWYAPRYAHRHTEEEVRALVRGRRPRGHAPRRAGGGLHLPRNEALGAALTGQLPERGEHPLVLLDRPRGRTHLGPCSVLDDQGPDPDECVVGKDDVVAVEAPGAEPAPRADPDAPSQHRVGDHECVLADLDVVSDMDEVVDLRASADDRVAEGAPVDCSERLDLDVILDHNAPDMRKLLQMPILVRLEPEAVAADHAARMNDHIAPDPDVVVDEALPVDDGARSDLGAFHHCVRADMDAIRDPSLRMDHGGRVDRPVRFRDKQLGNDPAEDDLGVAHDHQALSRADAARGVETVVAEHDARRGRLEQLLLVGTGRPDPHEIVGSRGGHRCRTDEGLPFRIAEHHVLAQVRLDVGQGVAAGYGSSRAIVNERRAPNARSTASICSCSRSRFASIARSKSSSVVAVGSSVAHQIG